MIVMKFGGSSLESASAIEQAASIVKEHLDRKPVVVVSAMGKTTDRLLDAARAAARGDSYSARQHIEAVRRMHFHETRGVLGQRAEPFLRDSIAPMFRELHELLVELSEGRPFTPEVQDQVLSYGERLSSLIVAEAFRHLGIHAAQVDARKVIVTGDQFTHAQPFYWDTYARLRRTVGLLARDRVVVMGGFMGATRRRRHHHAGARRIRLDGVAGRRGNFGRRDPDLDGCGRHAELGSARARRRLPSAGNLVSGSSGNGPLWAPRCCSRPRSRRPCGRGSRLSSGIRAARRWRVRAWCRRFKPRRGS
jgi:hypothetical protein